MKSLLIIGSGPIVIGQACEFDYSGSQAVKVLKKMGYKTILVNSNPATIMTDPELADRTYIEPLNLETLTKIIEQERPDALIPTLGGQTALNLAVQLSESGVLEKYSVELLGAKLDTIRKAENRELFKEIVLQCGYDVCKGGFAHTLAEAFDLEKSIGTYPLILRPSFTMGGTGASIAYNHQEFISLSQNALEASPISEVLIEESIIGWKEFELEIMRDKAGNFLVVCSIENFDPVGVHTGDSITVAPAQTLTDKQYQMMRDASEKISNAIGVETGGANIQYAINPINGRMIVIEMNPRVSRSSALASKATGFPIAKIAAQVAVGMTLDQILNDITKVTPASFEPSIDYVVTKIPRFNFDKFPQTGTDLGIQMKAVGEIMAIGKTFEESLEKACRSLENGINGIDAIWKKNPEESKEKLYRPNPERIFYIYAAIRNGTDLKSLQELTKIDMWFLKAIENIAVEYDSKPNKMKKVFAPVDTCSAEFEAFTPYYYSTRGEKSEVKPKTKKRVMIIGSGPNRIGQGIEFDYCCVHAIQGFQEEGYEVIMYNSNPETVSTDYDVSDILIFDPITEQDVLFAVEELQPDGVVLQFGGQTPIKLAKFLHEKGIKIFGTSYEIIDLAEDRDRFAQKLHDLGINAPSYAIASSKEELLQISEQLGFPVLIRPSYVLGGQGMRIVYSSTDVKKLLSQNFWLADNEHPIFVDRFLNDAIEFDVDVISDGTDAKIVGVLQQIEETGIHSGDSTAVFPAYDLDQEQHNFLVQETLRLVKSIGIIGLSNLQWALKDGEFFLLELNPRASRTIPFISKAVGITFANLAARILAGKSLHDVFPNEIPIPGHFAVKAVVFPFDKLGSPGSLGPEMKSTGEVMGISDTLGSALVKAFEATYRPIPSVKQKIFLSVHDDSKNELLNFSTFITELGYKIVSTGGTHHFLTENGIDSELCYKVDEQRPNVIDSVMNKEIGAVINIPGPSPEARTDLYILHEAATKAKIQYLTTVTSANMFLVALYAKQNEVFAVKPIQEYYKISGSSEV